MLALDYVLKTIRAEGIKYLSHIKLLKFENCVRIGRGKANPLLAGYLQSHQICVNIVGQLGVLECHGEEIFRVPIDSPS
jgi:hypothetical protein